MPSVSIENLKRYDQSCIGITKVRKTAEEAAPINPMRLKADLERAYVPVVPNARAADMSTHHMGDKRRRKRPVIAAPEEVDCPFEHDDEL